MLNARKDITNIYVFTGVIPALTLITFTVTGNNMTVREIPERIVLKAAHAALILVTA
jgi:hypothetical protein